MYQRQVEEALRFQDAAQVKGSNVINCNLPKGSWEISQRV